MNERVVRRIFNQLRNDVRGITLTRADRVCRRICADMTEKLNLLEHEVFKSEPAQLAPTEESVKWQ